MTFEADRVRFRVELGLPERGRIVMTGHQCAVWHPGIVSKYLAADAEARAGNADHAAWLWVDQDTDQTHTLRVPVTENGRLRAALWRLHPPPEGDVPSASMPAFTPASFVGVPALPQVGEGVRRLADALTRHAGAPNAARQTAAALSDLMAPLLQGPRPDAVFGTDLLRTHLGASLLARMRDDPRACAEHYNRAALAKPEAGVAALGLGADADSTELPLWRLAPGAARRRVRARDLRAVSSPDPRELAPRGLLMTGLVRLAACDLFIHGLGGGVYDTITEAWFDAWLAAPLCPTRVVTADLYLPLHPREVTARDVARARWRAHHARHAPDLLGDPDAADAKRRLLDQIRTAKRAGASPLPHYRALHELLARTREARHAPLRAIEREAEEAASLYAERDLARDRTWAFPFHTLQALGTLGR